METYGTVAALAVALLVLGMWLWHRHTRATSGRHDRYAPERILSTEQVHMLDYLQDTFPGHVVLPQILLRHMLSVRRTDNPRRAAQRLGQQRVDFVVCGEDGRPSFAFDVEPHHRRDTRPNTQHAKRKSQMLKTAGVRFVLLQNGLHRMPSPADFREQLNLAALPQPKARASVRESARQGLESQWSEFGPHHASAGSPDSEVMGLSGLMDLDAGARRRGHTDTEPPQHSGLDSRSANPRGG